MTMADRLVRIEDGRLAVPGATPEVTAVVRGKHTEIMQVAALGLDPVADTASAIRERISRFLYIDHARTYMAVPWHIDTQAAIWTVSPCSSEIGDTVGYIRKQLASEQAFYKAVDALIAGARRYGVRVEGWP
jgi:hypothetical protein